MDLFLYILLSSVYIMLIHFAISSKKESNIYLMAGCFLLAGVIGYFMHSYEAALGFGIILSLLFW